MQINDILIFEDAEFLTKKQTEIDKAGFLTKPAQILNPTSPLTFNGCIIIINEESLYMLQKGQKARIELINIASKNYKQAYMKQRACRAYLVIIC